MKLLCLDVPQPHATLDQYAPHLQDEVRFGWAQYRDGFVRDIYLRQDRPGVAILAEAESIEIAKERLMQFPLAKIGLIGWDVIPLGPFTNWELLFAKA